MNSAKADQCLCYFDSLIFLRSEIKIVCLKLKVSDTEKAGLCMSNQLKPKTGCL